MRFLSAVFCLVVILGLGAAATVYWMVGRVTVEMPDHTELADYKPPVLSRAEAADGSLIGEFARERRIFVPIADIPERVKDAFLSAEDKNFYEHRGIDVAAIVQAAVRNVGRAVHGERMTGASTITQQVAKNLLVGNERSLDRKVREAILALRMEKALSKARILEIYLNQIFLGERSYGVAAAAYNYFGKPLVELSVAEAAYLAALPKAPNNYHPVRNHESALERRNWVIGQMRENGRVTAEEALRAAAEPLAMRPPKDKPATSVDYVAEEVRRQALALLGEQAVYEGGLVIQSTMDPKMQSAATAALRDGLVAYDRRHGWRGPMARLKTLDGWRERMQATPVPAWVAPWALAVVLDVGKDAARIGLTDGGEGVIPLKEMAWARRHIDADRLGPKVAKAQDVLAPGDVVLVEPAEGGVFALRQLPMVQGALVAMDARSGRVQAMVGGFAFGHGTNAFNRATQALRQPGSSFKPFVYLTALQKGFTPSSIVEDSPVEVSQGPGLPVWRPQNYSGEYGGPTTLRVGLEKSKNVMTVRLAQAIGMAAIGKTAVDFGVYDALPSYLSLVLGSQETTVLRMTGAYAMLANGGCRVTPTLIAIVRDREGRLVYGEEGSDGRIECSAAAGKGDGGKGDGGKAVAAAPSGAEVVKTGGASEAVGDPAAAPSAPTPAPKVVVPVADQRAVYQIVSMMEGVVRRGTARGLRTDTLQHTAPDRAGGRGVHGHSLMEDFA